MIAALARPVQPRLVDAALDDRYLALLLQILDAAVLQAIAHRPLAHCLGHAQEPLALGQALASTTESWADRGGGEECVHPWRTSGIPDETRKKDERGNNI